MATSYSLSQVPRRSPEKKITIAPKAARLWKCGEAEDFSLEAISVAHHAVISEIMNEYAKFLAFVALISCHLSSAFHQLSNVARFKNSIASLDVATTAQQSASSGIGWDSHKAIDQIPESLVRSIDGNESMRRKFEAACRNAQVSCRSSA